MTDSAELSRYSGELSSRLSTALGSDLIGVWLLGSAALGGFSPERSDVDVLAVSRTVPSLAARRSVVDLIGPDALPCPAQGLEFVWYARSDVQPLADPPSYQLNLNGGRLREHKIQFGPGAEAEHWFVIDLAIGRDHAVPLLGPPLADVVTPIPRPRLLDALRRSLAWHDENDAGSPNQVLNAARTIQFLETGLWTNKLDAARRIARDHPALRQALVAAEQARNGGPALDPEPAASVVRAAQALLH